MTPPLFNEFLKSGDTHRVYKGDKHLFASDTDVYSLFGSKLAAVTLDKYGIQYNLSETIPYILNRDGADMCPMEEFSIDKNPEEFYEALKRRRGG